MEDFPDPEDIKGVRVETSGCETVLTVGRDSIRLSELEVGRLIGLLTMSRMVAWGEPS